jgi:hypothetical protein
MSAANMDIAVQNSQILLICLYERSSSPRNAPCSTRKIPNRSESKATWVKKKKLPSRSVRLGRVSTSRMKGGMPKSNVAPGWLFQQEGRIHQTRMQRMRVAVTVALSRFLNERISAGRSK